MREARFRAPCRPTKGSSPRLRAAPCFSTRSTTRPSDQVKLLRVLEKITSSADWREHLAAGGFPAARRDQSRSEPLVAEGRFGADLYARLAIVRIHLPPLRERRDDPLSRRPDDGPFAREQRTTRMRRHTGGASRLDGLRVARQHSRAAERDLTKRWSGTNAPAPKCCWRTCHAGSAGSTARADGVVDAAAVRAARVRDGRMNLRREIEALERAALSSALEESGGNASRAASLLGAVGRGAAKDPGGTVRAMKRRLRYRG